MTTFDRPDNCFGRENLIISRSHISVVAAEQSPLPFPHSHCLAGALALTDPSRGCGTYASSKCAGSSELAQPSNATAVELMQFLALGRHLVLFPMAGR